VLSLLAKPPEWLFNFVISTLGRFNQQVHARTACTLFAPVMLKPMLGFVASLILLIMCTMSGTPEASISWNASMLLIPWSYAPPERCPRSHGHGLPAVLEMLLLLPLLMIVTHHSHCQMLGSETRDSVCLLVRLASDRIHVCWLI
jgi:hypothetical protein